MQLEVSPELQERIESLVQSGAYPSAAAVLDAALDAGLDALDPKSHGYSEEELVAFANEGRESLRHGPARDAWEVADELRALVARKAALRRQ